MLSERKKELFNYIHLLRDLNADGMGYEDELRQSVNELHSLMYPKGVDFKILVLEEDDAGIDRTVRTFKNTLDNKVYITDKVGENVYMSNDHVRIAIFKVEDAVKEDRLREEPVDYVINNTTDTKAVEKIGIRIKT